MSNHERRNICTIDHANKRRELARQTPYQFWLDQVKRRETAFPASGEAVKQAPASGTGSRKRR